MDPGCDTLDPCHLVSLELVCLDLLDLFHLVPLSLEFLEVAPKFFKILFSPHNKRPPQILPRGLLPKSQGPASAVCLSAQVVHIPTQAYIQPLSIYCLLSPHHTLQSLLELTPTTHKFQAHPGNTAHCYPHTQLIMAATRPKDKRMLVGREWRR